MRPRIPPAARVVLAGRLDALLPLLLRRHRGRRAAARQLEQALRPRGEPVRLHTGQVRRVEGERQHGRQPRRDRRECLEAVGEALHADVDVQAADQLALHPRSELLDHLQVTLLGDDLLLLRAGERMRAGGSNRKPLGGGGGCSPRAGAGSARPRPPRPTHRQACSSRPGTRRALSSAPRGRAAARRRARERASRGRGASTPPRRPPSTCARSSTFHAQRARDARPPPRRNTRRSARSCARRAPRAGCGRPPSHAAHARAGSDRLVPPTRARGAPQS